MNTPVQPLRHLCGPKPKRYVRACLTDIRVTFKKHRRLQALQRAKREQQS